MNGVVFNSDRVNPTSDTGNGAVIDSEGNLYWYRTAYFYGNAYPGFDPTPFRVPLNQWTHLVFVTNQIKKTIYVNGTESRSSTFEFWPGRESSGITCQVAIGGSGKTPQFGALPPALRNPNYFIGDITNVYVRQKKTKKESLKDFLD